MRVRVPVPTTVFALALFVLPPPAIAALRAPQVAISGDRLQAHLNRVGEHIDVRTDQNAIQFFRSTVSPNAAFTTQFELMSGGVPGSSLGIYDASVVTPVPMELFPSGSRSGWLAVASFRSSPVRVIVNVFDETASLLSSTTYPGGNKDAIGFYMDGEAGRFYSQDHRNPAGDAQMLWFAGTGINWGDWWIAGEDAPLSGGADADFDDFVIFADPLDHISPVQQCTWGAVKARFQ